MKLTGKSVATDNAFEFTYQGLQFSQQSFHIFAGLNAVDTEANVVKTMQFLQANQLQCARMGVYKPRTSAYTFQGHGRACLPYVFENAGKYGIKVIAMEVTHESHIEEIHSALQASGQACGVMLQTGTRNAQNFELLRAVGQQSEYPVLYKRGYGITLEESLHAAEYIAHYGNPKIIFCLRGVKTHLGNPHRNLSDFIQVPMIKRLSRHVVGIDPSHCIGMRGHDPDLIDDIFHAAAQGVIAGANFVLCDVHPTPREALVDSRQALSLNELETLVQDLYLARMCYLRRTQLARLKQNRTENATCQSI